MSLCVWIFENAKCYFCYNKKQPPLYLYLVFVKNSSAFFSPNWVEKLYFFNEESVSKTIFFNNNLWANLTCMPFEWFDYRTKIQSTVKTPLVTFKHPLCAHHSFVVVFECRWAHKPRVSIEAPLCGSMFVNCSKFSWKWIWIKCNHTSSLVLKP